MEYNTGGFVGKLRFICLKLIDYIFYFMKPRSSTEGFEVCVIVHVILFNFLSQFKQKNPMYSVSWE